MTSIIAHERLLLEQKERIMATEVGVHVAVAPGEAASARAAIDSSMAWFREVDRRLTRFSAESELSHLNASAGCWFATSEVLFTAVRDALAAAQASDGLFDPALLPQLEALGYDRDFSLLTQRSGEADEAEVQASYPLGLWRDIKLDVKARRIHLPTGARLDLGGIAKGWAADRAIKRFFQHVDNVIVNVGGDLRMRGGPREGELWAIGIGDLDETGHADTSNHRAVITFGRGGLATSGSTRRWWYHQGTRQHHVLDPRTGRPVPLWMHAEQPEPEAIDAGSLIATLMAPAPIAARAEVATKMALLRGYPEALRAVEAAWQNDLSAAPHLPADRGVALLLVLGNGEVAVSANLEAYLETCAGGGMLWL